jgi:hypothetical protein
MERREGPAPFACTYLNGRSGEVPPILLALDSLHDLDGLLEAATKAHRSTRTLKKEEQLTTIYLPDGSVLPKKSKILELPHSCVLVLSCGEPFDAASLPQRVRLMHLSQQKRRQLLGGLVTSNDPITQRGASPGRAGQQEQQRTPRSSPRPKPEPLHSEPWTFSPSGRWQSPLQQRPGRF